MFCDHCGTPNPEDAHYCSACGRRVDLEAPAQNVPISPGQENPTCPQSEAGPKHEPTKEELLRRIDEVEKKLEQCVAGTPQPDSRRLPPEPQTPSMVSSIGPYALGADVTSHQGLAELTSLEYLAMPKEFPGESIFKCPPVDFLGRTWEIWIGAIEGCIYKILAQRSSSGAVDVLPILHHCWERLGKPTKWKEKIGMNWTTTIWSMDEGNVVLGYGGEAFGTCQVSLALTSAVVVRSKSVAKKKGFLRRLWG